MANLKVLWSKRSHAKKIVAIGQVWMPWHKSPGVTSKDNKKYSASAASKGDTQAQRKPSTWLLGSILRYEGLSG